MRDRNLERNIKRVEAFVERWKQLSQFLDRGFQGQSFTSEEESAFLDLKSNIAQEYELLMTTLASSERDDKPLKLLNTVPSLQSFKELNEGMAKKVATDWHNTYISLQALLGRQRGRQVQLSQISSLSIGFKRVFGNPIMIILVAVAAGYGVYKFAEEMFPVIEKFIEMEKTK
jgi:hypothetical protein